MDDGNDKQAEYMARPKAADVQAQTRDAERQVRGFQCPKCHCCNFRVDTTRPKPNEIRRYRLCRNCGYRIATLETLEG